MSLGIFFGVTAGVVHIVAYIFYNYVSKNRPNIAAWGVWAFLSILSMTSYVVMSSDWVKSILVSVNALLCILTLVLALYRGRFEKLDRLDKIAFAIGVLAGLMWIVLKSATYANMILQVSIMVGFIPLYRGIWRNPKCEHALPWLIWVVAYCLNILTIVVRWTGQYQDLAYPVNCFVLHLAVALLVVVRTRTLLHQNERTSHG